ncbi:hypothetical protein AC1031_015413 [Aphanomyces cochlioides]|nr:hypothetical protein AC1031_015413 [Aphanomyces cochlioides]
MQGLGGDTEERRHQYSTESGPHRSGKKTRRGEHRLYNGDNSCNPPCQRRKIKSKKEASSKTSVDDSACEGYFADGTEDDLSLEEPHFCLQPRTLFSRVLDELKQQQQDVDCRAGVADYHGLGLQHPTYPQEIPATTVDIGSSTGQTSQEASSKNSACDEYFADRTEDDLSLKEPHFCLQSRTERQDALVSPVRTPTSVSTPVWTERQDAPASPVRTPTSVSTPVWTERQDAPVSPVRTPSSPSTPPTWSQRQEDVPTPEDSGHYFSTPPTWSQRQEDVPTPEDSGHYILTPPTWSQRQEDVPTPEDSGHYFSTPPTWSQRQEDVPTPEDSGHYILTPPTWSQRQEDLPTPVAFGTSTLHCQEKEPGRSPGPRRSSLSHEQQQRQHMFDKQVRPIDSKHEDGLAREVDSFRRQHEEKYRVKHDYLAEEKD